MGETRRLKFVVSYDGGGYAGWQSQVHGNTIQDQLECAFGKIGGGKIAVIGAGRTDAGVHALGQCAHADVPAGKLAAANWLKALNGTLPLTIRILRARFVPESFHARFSSRAKLYRYRIANGAIMSPLELGRAWHVPRMLDLTTLKKGVALFLGTHDFAGFAARRGKMEADTVRTITSVRVTHRGDLIAIEVWGDGFLYKMVRMMVGALVRCALGKHSLETIALRLKNAARADSGSALVSSAGEGVSPSRTFCETSPQGKVRFGGPPKSAPGTGALPELRRMIAGGSVAIGISNPEHAEVATGILHLTETAPRFVAPAEGLYLVRVQY